MNAARSLRTIVRQTRIETVSLETIAEYVPCDRYEPFNDIQYRIDLIKEALGCSDEEAEHLVLNHNRR